MFSIKEFFFVIPELVLLFSAVSLMILYPITLRPKQIQINGISAKVRIDAIYEYRFTLILIYLVTLYVLYLIPVSESISLFEQQYLLTPATQFCKALLLIAIIILLLVAPYQSRFNYWEEHIILTVFIIISGMLMISANDFLVLWLASEFQTFSFVIGIAFFRHGERATNGAMVYFVTSALIVKYFLAWDLAYIWGDWFDKLFDVRPDIEN
jgi:NADH:ubiquinone oxidoreductase subunit 2 (subunit N)